MALKFRIAGVFKLICRCNPFAQPALSAGMACWNRGPGLAPVASLPCCFHRDASRSERPMKFEGFGLTDLRDELDIADVVMEQRSARCLLRVRGGGAGPAAALQVDLNKRTPRPKPLSERQRLPLVRLVYRTQVAANSASGRVVSGAGLQTVRCLCPSYYYGLGPGARPKEEREKQRGMPPSINSPVPRRAPPQRSG